jgi:sigma-B regulation protein RsbU (phosphoserine phosphatase)
MCPDFQRSGSSDAGEILGTLLQNDADENRRSREEIHLARQVQIHMFSDEFPDVPGYEFYGTSTPVHGVSSDYYGVMEREPIGDCVLLIADVAGSGLAASILTGFLEALTSTAIERGLEPHHVLDWISPPFFNKTPARQYATMMLAVISADGRSIRYANAGHPPGFVVRRDGAVDWLQPTGIPIGVLADAHYLCESNHLDQGDLLVLYSDGYPGAIDPDEREFGADRLADIVVRHRDRRLPVIGARLEITIRELAAGRQTADDRTMLMARRTE